MRDTTEPTGLNDSDACLLRFARRISSDMTARAHCATPFLDAADEQTPRADADLAMAAKFRGCAGRAPRKLPPFTSLIPSTVKIISPRPSNLTPRRFASWSPSSFPMSSQTRCMSLHGGRCAGGKRAWASMINSAVHTGGFAASMVAGARWRSSQCGTVDGCPELWSCGRRLLELPSDSRTRMGAS